MQIKYKTLTLKMRVLKQTKEDTGMMPVSKSRVQFTQYLEGLMLISLFFFICMLIRSLFNRRVQFTYIVPSRFHSYLSILFFMPNGLFLHGMLKESKVNESHFLEIVRKMKLMEFSYITHVIYSGSFLSGVMIQVVILTHWPKLMST